MKNDLINMGDLLESNLICKSALLETLEQRIDQMNRRCVTDIYMLGKLAGFNDAIKVVKATLTLDAEPVRHGKWAHLGGDEWCCTVCGEVIHTEGSWEKPTLKYCHECGAKMDGDVDG